MNTLHAQTARGANKFGGASPGALRLAFAEPARLWSRERVGPGAGSGSVALINRTACTGQKLRFTRFIQAERMHSLRPALEPQLEAL